MADKNGNKTGGRVAGVPNKKNQEVYDLAEEFGITPMRVKYMLMCGKFEDLGFTKAEVEELSVRDRLDIRSRNAEAIAPYMYGKRKPVDSEGNDDKDPLSALINELRERT